MTWTDLLGTALVVAGLPFFVAGTIGLIRLPDVYGRLHALAKADTVGLALVALGTALLQPSLGEGLRVALVWAVAAAVGAPMAHVVAEAALRAGVRPWRRR